MNKINQILTKPDYWDSLPNSAKAYWQKTANHCQAIVCTDRPNSKKFKGAQHVRRASTGGRWGKSADHIFLDLNALLSSGYVWRQYNQK